MGEKVENVENVEKVEKAEKIFSIGFGKCGTTTIYTFLFRNGLNTIHGGPHLKQWFASGNLERIRTRADCYVYDSLTLPFNIPLIYKNFPDAYYILATRSFLNWLISLVIHFRFEEFTSLNVYEFLIMRNNFYEKVLNLNIKNLKIINIEKDDICHSLISFLPPFYTKKEHNSLITNKTTTSLKNKDGFIDFIYDALDKCQVSKEDAHNPLVIRDKNGKSQLAFLSPSTANSKFYPQFTF